MFAAFESPIAAIACLQMDSDLIVEIVKIAVALRLSCPDGFPGNPRTLET
jgi:hypothetical protein